MGEQTSTSASRKRKRGKRPNRLRRWFYYLFLLPVGVFFLVSFHSVLLLRWFDPLFSMVMVEKFFEQGLTVPSYSWSDLEEMSPYMPVACIAAEDQRFPEHHGFDVEAIKKVLEKAGEGGRVRGASTISQQTAKNLFLFTSRSWIRKGLEAYFTVLLEMLLSKQRIIEIYCNIAQMDVTVFGVGAASRHHFGKPPSKLTKGECALLAAVLPNPERFKASRPSPYILKRQGWILRQMSNLGGERLLEQL